MMIFSCHIIPFARCTTNYCTSSNEDKSRSRLLSTRGLYATRNTCTIRLVYDKTQHLYNISRSLEHPLQVSASVS